MNSILPPNSALAVLMIALLWAGAATARAQSGALDASFDAGAVDGAVQALVVRGDAVWIAGSFKEAGGERRNSVARLDSRGRAIEAFDPGLGPDAAVLTLVVRADNKVITGTEVGSCCRLQTSTTLGNWQDWMRLVGDGNDQTLILTNPAATRCFSRAVLER